METPCEMGLTLLLTGPPVENKPWSGTGDQALFAGPSRGGVPVGPAFKVQMMSRLQASGGWALTRAC